MNLNDLRKSNVKRCQAARPEGFGHSLNSWSVAEWTNAMAGEAGEACNIAKKMIRFRDNVAGNALDMSRADYAKLLAREIADVVIYADLVLASEGLGLSEAIADAFNKKSAEIGSPIQVTP